ncbi:MAG: BRCT domain-containing protein [Betaproteobacteria bacterium]|nr:BRCT domain-containing protein [Betaproteobacteria bacterium]
MANFFARQGAAYANEMKRSFGALVGIAQGLLGDRQLSDQEIGFLNEWLQANDAIATAWPGDVVHTRIKAVLADGVVTEEERSHLVETLSKLVGGSLEQLAQSEHVTGLAFDDVSSVSFSGSRFCLTGEFVYAPREVCSAAIESRGGTVGGVTKKLSYLVIGGLGSPEWKHGSFGTKIEKAMQYKREGLPILVVHEDTWASSL